MSVQKDFEQFKQEFTARVIQDRAGLEARVEKFEAIATLAIAYVLEQNQQKIAEKYDKLESAVRAFLQSEAKS